jgi:hypothetical protein
MEVDMENNCETTQKPLLTFGIIADVQYGDINDEIVYGRMRYYRDSFKSVRRIIRDWQVYEQSPQNTKVEFIVQLGDLIEGFRVKGKTEKKLNIVKVLSELERLYPEHDFAREYDFKLEGNEVSF